MFPQQFRYPFPAYPSPLFPQFSPHPRRSVPLEIHVLNLERLPPEGEGKLADWLRFLKAETEEEFKMAAEKNPMIQEANCKR
jgi:hypothetical protein